MPCFRCLGLLLNTMPVCRQNETCSSSVWRASVSVATHAARPRRMSAQFVEPFLDNNVEAVCQTIEQLVRTRGQEAFRILINEQEGA